MILMRPSEHRAADPAHGIMQPIVCRTTVANNEREGSLGVIGDKRVSSM